jgi:hypothetical protein
MKSKMNRSRHGGEHVAEAEVPCQPDPQNRKESNPSGALQAGADATKTLGLDARAALSNQPPQPAARLVAGQARPLTLLRIAMAPTHFTNQETARCDDLTNKAPLPVGDGPLIDSAPVPRSIRWVGRNRLSARYGRTMRRTNRTGRARGLTLVARAEMGSDKLQGLLMGGLYQLAVAAR